MCKKIFLLLNVMTLLIFGAMFTLADVPVAEPVVLETTPAGMYIGTKYVGEMNREQVGAAIDSLTAELNAKAITIVSNSGSVAIPLADMQITCVNRDSLVIAALGEHGYGNFITQYKQEKDTEHNGLHLAPEYAFNSEVLINYLLNTMPGLETRPQNASIRSLGGGQFEVLSSVPGFSVDYDATYAAVVAAIKRYNGDELETVTVAGVQIPATYDDSIFDGFGSLLGSWTTKYLCKGENEDRATNIRVAASKISGLVMMPGHEFSFVQAMQPFTEESGFKNAGTILDGTTTDDLGGGVCQVSTTLYNACLYAELDITYRHAHSMASTYVDSGLDAMVYVKDGQDYRFVNNTGHPIYIEAYTTPDYEGKSSYEGITFNIYGTEYRDPERSIWYEGVTISKEWPVGDIGSYALKIDDELDAAGNDYGGNNMMRVGLYPHPKLVAKVIKHEYISGVEVSTTEISYDDYNSELGTLYFNSNTVVENIEFDPDSMIITDITVVGKKNHTESSSHNTTSESESVETTGDEETNYTEPSDMTDEISSEESYEYEEGFESPEDMITEAVITDPFISETEYVESQESEIIDTLPSEEMPVAEPEQVPEPIAEDINAE